MIKDKWGNVDFARYFYGGGTMFWMVYGEGKSAPTVKHATVRLAEEEAKRLAAKHPGVKFHVLGNIGCYSEAPPVRQPVKWEPARAW